MNDISDIDLLKELGVELEVEKPKQFSPLEARLIAGFEDILKFVDDHGHAPQHGEDNDIFERLYAVRLDQLRKNEQARSLLAAMDKAGLLGPAYQPLDANIDDEALLAELGAASEPQNNPKEDITKLRNVSPIKHRRAAEDIANREVCRDFDTFEPLFEKVKRELDAGVLDVRKFRKDAGFLKTDFKQGQFVIIAGQTAYIADIGLPQKAPNGEHDVRLRVIYSNGTESDILLRSLVRAMYKDETSRFITDNTPGPLFADTEENQTGIIYVLRSKSELPEVASIRDAIVKIGVTGEDVKKRIANAAKEATYLLGEVEIIDEYTLYNVNRKKLEKLLHRIFANARLKISIKDRFGNPFEPQEWFMVPPAAVAKAVELIQNGDIKKYDYDHKAAMFISKEIK